MKGSVPRSVVVLITSPVWTKGSMRAIIDGFEEATGGSLTGENKPLAAFRLK